MRRGPVVVVPHEPWRGRRPDLRVAEERDGPDPPDGRRPERAPFLARPCISPRPYFSPQVRKKPISPITPPGQSITMAFRP